MHSGPSKCLILQPGERIALMVAESGTNVPRPFSVCLDGPDVQGSESASTCEIYGLVVRKFIAGCLGVETKWASILGLFYKNT